MYAIETFVGYRQNKTNKFKEKQFYLIMQRYIQSFCFGKLNFFVKYAKYTMLNYKQGLYNKINNIFY